MPVLPEPAHIQVQAVHTLAVAVHTSVEAENMFAEAVHTSVEAENMFAEAVHMPAAVPHSAAERMPAVGVGAVLAVAAHCAALWAAAVVSASREQAQLPALLPEPPHRIRYRT